MKISELREQLLYLMTKYNIVTGKGQGVSDRVNELTNQLALLTSTVEVTPTTVGAPCTGYFISATDGYEQIFSGETVMEMTPETFETAANSVAESYASAPGVVGKIATGFKWYYACVLSAEETDEIEERVAKGSKIWINMESCSNEELAVTVAAINRQEQGDAALVVFECKNMSETLANVRHENVSIIIGKHQGLGINKKSIRAIDFELELSDQFDYAIEKDGSGNDVFVKRSQKDGSVLPMDSHIDPYKVVKQTDEDGNVVYVEKNVQAVYVLLANQIYAKRINIIYDSGESEGTVICQTMDGTAVETSRYIKLYDNVVVEGRKLYDGKVVK